MGPLHAKMEGCSNFWGLVPRRAARFFVYLPVSEMEEVEETRLRFVVKTTTVAILLLLRRSERRENKV